MRHHFQGCRCSHRAPGARSLCQAEQGRQSQRSQGPGVGRVARSLAAGAAGRQQMDGLETGTRGLPGNIPKAFCSLLKGLVTITAAVGPLSAAGKGIGEALFKSEVPIQRQPTSVHLVATGPPLTQSPSATGHTAPSREAGISRRGMGPSRRVPG